MELTQEEYERLLHRSRLMDLAEDILIVLDTFGVILDVNNAAAEMHGGVVEDFIGRNCADFLHPASAAKMMEVATGIFFSGVDSSDSMELRAIRHDGSTVHLQLRVSYSVSEEKFYVVERDVTEQVNRTSELVALSEELRLQALTDTLTSVPNRAAFDQEMTHIEDEDLDAWLVVLDIDYFKAINDTFGHVVGDGLLKSIADSLSSVMESEDLLARIGGDEFAIIVPGVEELTFQRRLDEIGDLVNRSVAVDGLQLHLACSYGATRRSPGETIANWMRRSDRAMYAQKAAGREVVEAA